VESGDRKVASELRSGKGVWQPGSVALAPRAVGVVPSADLVVVRLGRSRPDQALDPGELLSDPLAALTR